MDVDADKNLLFARGQVPSGRADWQSTEVERKSEGDGNQACWSRYWRLQASKEQARRLNIISFPPFVGGSAVLQGGIATAVCAQLGEQVRMRVTRRDQAVGSDRSCQHVAAG